MTVDLTKIPPLDWQFPITDPETGRPSPQFIRLWQQMFGNSETLGTVVDNNVIAGAGLDGGGSLSDGDVTIDANASDILDLISSTRGTVLYRGSLGWSGLAPSTTGKTLRTNGAGADPTWDTMSNLLDVISSTRGSILYRGAAGWSALSPGTSGYLLTANGAGADPTWTNAAGSGGTVTSVALTAPAEFSVGGSPVTSSGTLALTWGSQAANKFLASPNGSSGVPSFRSIVAADIPTLNQNTTGSAATLTSARSFTMTGDVTWTVTFDGSANVSAAGTIANNAVSNAKLATVATATFKGRTTAGTGNVEDLTGTQATALLDVFTTSLKGLTPSSGGGTTNFLRADGTWAVPPGSGSGTVTTTGSPASGNLTKFSGGTSITNGDLTGDVTTSGTLATTIANDAVTYAKMQNVSATSKILGRKTAGSGDPEECSLSDVLDFVGSAAQGDILYRGASTWTRLAAGTSGYALMTNGAGADPAWGAVTSGTALTILSQPQGRLTLVSGIPVTRSDQTAKTAVYYTPYSGANAPIYSGSTWSMTAFTEQTLNLDTTNHLVDRVYDVFIWSNSGTFSIGAGPAWAYSSTVTMTIASPCVVTWTGHGLVEGDTIVFTTSGALPTGITAGTIYYVGRSVAVNTFNISTTRANAAAGTFVNTSGSQSGTHTGTNTTRARGTGAGTTELQMKDGIWTNKNSITLTNGAGAGTSGIAANTATYVGSIFCTANGQTGMAVGSGAGASGGNNSILGVYNAYNRLLTGSNSKDSTSSWSINTGSTFRATNNSVSNRISFIDGLGQSTIRAFHLVRESGNAGLTAVALNLTNGYFGGHSLSSSGSTQNPLSVEAAIPPLLGFSYVQAVEWTNATCTFTGGDAEILTVTLEM